MPKVLTNNEFLEIEAVIRDHPEGLPLERIALRLPKQINPRSLQRRLKKLEDAGRVIRLGGKRFARYAIAQPPPPSPPQTDAAEIPLSAPASEVRNYVRQPITARTPVGYNRTFLDDYEPNVSSYLSKTELQRLHLIGAARTQNQPAGTYARKVLGRLLIDLAWNSSRLEGNTYSLLDTQKLLARGEVAEGRDAAETQMILNHKDAIEFLVDAAEEIGANRYTVLNLHALLANNLLPDPEAVGRLRTHAVGIGGSTFIPLESPPLIEECFDALLGKAGNIADPFEQALFMMVQLPYLQPFDDVNKRVSRLAANIPLIKQNLSPLSFVDVPPNAYVDGLLGVYELNRIELTKDVFMWAYHRSAQRYAAIQQSLGEPDAFRLAHREAIRALVGEIVRGPLSKALSSGHIARWASQHIGDRDRARFQEVVEHELLALNDGNFARYKIRPSEFRAWRLIWD